MTECYDCEGTGIQMVPLNDSEIAAAKVLIDRYPDLSDESVMDLSRGYRTTDCSFCGGSGQDPAAR